LAPYYIAWILALFAWVLNFWGWWRWIEAILDSNRYTTYSSWRVNMLNAVVVCVLTAWIFGATVIWWRYFDAYKLIYPLVSSCVVVYGAWMIWVYVQNLWWNYDYYGSMADEAGWDWFASESEVDEYDEDYDYYYYC